MNDNQWYLADNEVAIDELGFTTVEGLLDHYNFDGNPQKVELVLLDSNNKLIDSGYYNTKSIL